MLQDENKVISTVRAALEVCVCVCGGGVESLCGFFAHKESDASQMPDAYALTYPPGPPRLSHDSINPTPTAAVQKIP